MHQTRRRRCPLPTEKQTDTKKKRGERLTGKLLRTTRIDEKGHGVKGENYQTHSIGRVEDGEVICGENSNIRRGRRRSRKLKKRISINQSREEISSRTPS